MLTAPSSATTFAHWQPKYAEQGIATFPVEFLSEGNGKWRKKPSIKGWQKVGQQASSELANKFGEAGGIGCQCGPRNQITVADIDCPDPAAVKEAEKLLGPSPLMWRTASGNYAIPYRHNGERRHIRPFPGLDIDILGGGLIALPPSVGAGSPYEIVRGTLDDFRNLPPINAALDRDRGAPIPEGRRDKTAFSLLLRQARHCDDFDSLLDVARTINADCIPPMTDAQLVKITRSAWGYEITGKNWVGRKARASTDRDEILSLRHSPGAMMLLQLLRVSFPREGMTFPIDQVKTSEVLRWNPRTLVLRIGDLIEAGYLRRVRLGRGKGCPHLYKLLRRHHV